MIDIAKSRVITCPYCNAVIHCKENAKKVKCEYCRSFIDIEPDPPEKIIIEKNNYYTIPPTPVDTAELEKLNEEFKKKRKKWIAASVAAVIATFVLSFVSGLVTYLSDSAAGMAICGMSIFFPILSGCILGRTKPLSPVKKQSGGRFFAGMFVFVLANGAFWAGLIISAIVAAVVNSNTFKNREEVSDTISIEEEYSSESYGYAEEESTEAEELFYAEYLVIDPYTDETYLVFFVEDNKVMEAGQMAEEVNSSAYMNGYNWDVLLNFYIEQEAPHLSGTYESDPEASMYFATFTNQSDAEEAADIIMNFVENPHELAEFVERYGDDIQWE